MAQGQKPPKIPKVRTFQKDVAAAEAAGITAAPKQAKKKKSVLFGIGSKKEVVKKGPEIITPKSTTEAVAPIPQRQPQKHDIAPSTQQSRGPEIARKAPPQQSLKTPQQKSAQEKLEEKKKPEVPKKPVPPIRKPAPNVAPASNALRGTGVIVQDRIKNRWSFRKALKESMEDWWDETKDSLGGSQKAPPVAPAAKREEIVEAASKDKHIAPQDDHRKVIQKIRTFSKDAEDVTGKPYVIHRQTSADAPKWKQVSDPTHSDGLSRVIEETASAVPEKKPEALEATSIKRARPLKRQVDDLRRGEVLSKDHAGAVAPKAEQKLPDTAFIPHELEPKEHVEERIEKEKRSIKAARDRLKVLQQQEAAPVEVAPEPEHVVPPVAAQTPAEAAPQAQESAEDFALPTFEKQETASIRTYRSDAIEDVEERELSVPKIAAAEMVRNEKRDTPLRRLSTLSILPFGLAAGVLLVLIIISSTIYLQFFRGPSQDTLPEIPSLVMSSHQQQFVLPDSREALLTRLSELTSNSSVSQNGVVQFYPVAELGVTEEPLGANTIMEVFDPQAPGAFLRTLNEEMMFGAAGEKRAPFIALSVKQFDTAFAGMLAWEDAMSADFSPLFGEPVRRTLDPNALTNDTTRRARFVDETIRNHDVRILYNELGEERLIYAFVNQNTIIITTSTDGFVTILSAL